MKQALQELGLTKTETEVYLALIDLGPSLAGLISRRTGIHRRSVYDATERLIKKGLIGYIKKNNRRNFEAVSPSRILEIIKEKEEAISNAMPVLEKRYLSSKEVQETNFYKGKDGLKTVFEDQLQVGKEVMVLGASEYADEQLKYYITWYNKRRAQKKMNVRLVYNKRTKIKKAAFTEVRYLEMEQPSHASTNIYGDRVAIILWSKEKPFVILIKDEEITKGYRSYFEHLWKIARK